MKSGGNGRMALCALALSLSACSNSADKQAQGRLVQPNAGFTEEDKRIAQLLSVSGDALRSGQTPEFQALACSAALTTLQQKAVDGQMLSDEQEAVLRRFQGEYYRRATASLSGDEIAKLQQEVDAEYPEQSDRARLAIGCIRDITEM